MRGKKLINPRPYRENGLNRTAFRSFGGISISPCLKVQAFGCKIKNQAPRGFRSCRNAAKQSKLKKIKLIVSPLQALKQHNAQATSIQNLDFFFFLVVCNRPNCICIITVQFSKLLGSYKILKMKAGRLNYVILLTLDKDNCFTIDPLRTSNF